MNDADLLKPYLDKAAEKLKWHSFRKPVTMSNARNALRKVLTEHGVVSIRVEAALTPVIAQYFDAHDNFKRISDGPEWALRVKPARREAGQ